VTPIPSCGQHTALGSVGQAAGRPGGVVSQSMATPREPTVRELPPARPVEAEQTGELIGAAP
jgi:hypothetical protein